MNKKHITASQNWNFSDYTAPYDIFDFISLEFKILSSKTRSRCQVYQGNVESPQSSTKCSHQSMDRWYPYVYIQAHTRSSQEFQRNRWTFTEKKSRRRY